MRILFLTPFVPRADAPHGGGVYVANHVRSLANHAELGLCALCPPGQAWEPEPGLWQWQSRTELPSKATGVAGLCQRGANLWRWRHLPLVVCKAQHPGFATAIQQALAQFRPTVVCVEQGQLAQYLPLLTAIPTLLTDHEAGCSANTRTGLGAWGDARDRRLWHHFARQYYGKATAVQAVTQADAHTLQALLGRPVGTRPLSYHVPERSVRPERSPPRALFLGSYSHGPNPQAARHLATRVWPLVLARQPDAELWLAGPDGNNIADLAKLPGVRVLGYVEDLAGLLGQVRFMLAPLYQGGGVRIKALTAISHGLPLVTNALGARGCDAPEPAVVRAENDAALAHASLRWLADPADAQRAGTLAQAWAAANLRPDAVAKHQLALLHELVQRWA